MIIHTPHGDAIPLAGKHILMFVGDIYEDQELHYPRYRMIEAGAQVTLAGEEAGVTYKSKYGYPAVSDAAARDLKGADFDGLIVPGGFMPDRLRRNDDVKRLTREIAEAGRLVAAICHGGWIPISAGVYGGVRLTSTPGIRDDLVNAGAVWEDAPVVVDRHFVSSRRPDDLPDFCRAILDVLAKQG